ncbi:toll/interleukin-1 receptor domain-containing protein [Streptomyces armeniacus]|uniref:Toll/interleukin-1 receptor domain-containing protein n=1 Tax=Streptomyces armeniacus TaxID=83291 RepID=A0A345XL95_9ACTN|nr:toll/interleukin-1 receptor domain-containing protein [Streptomyces armeniacus]AXK32411.1 toll/interleukin-1 receptor domain-containing protein [Streptomyces armeniacus]
MSPSEIFVNYRTTDEASSAVLIEDKLSQRFGSDSVFRDHKSIKAGEKYPEKLLSGVRRCSVLIAVIGPEWTSARNERGQRSLDNVDDWTRREIVEALHCGVHVIPVLVTPRTAPLTEAELPAALADLAHRQYRQFNARTFNTDITQLGDDIAELVPRLGRLDRDFATRAPQHPSGSVRNSVADVHGSVTQTGDYTNQQTGGIGSLTGDVGTFLDRPQGPVNTGSGPQYYGSVHQTGDGANQVSGSNDGGIRQEFGKSQARRDKNAREGGGE